MKTKYCPGCNRSKSVKTFRPNKKRSDGLQGYCRKCDKRKQAEYYQRNKPKLRIKRRQQRLSIKRNSQKKVWEYLLNHPCKCGESDPRLLEFDHINREEKLGTVCEIVSRGWSWSRVFAEIGKCEVMCVRCHRLKTFKEMGWKSWLIVGST